MEKLKHEASDKKMLSDLDQKIQEILQSNRPDSEKVTLYNEALQKSKLFLKKFQPKTRVKKPLSDKAVFKRYKKRAATQRSKKQKELRLGCRRSNGVRQSSGTRFEYRRFVSICAAETQSYFTWRANLYGRVFTLLRTEKKRLFLGIPPLSKTVVAIARHLYAPQTSKKKIQAKKNDCARRSLSNASGSR